MATVSAFQVDDTGTQVWRVCSVAQNNEGVMMCIRGGMAEWAATYFRPYCHDGNGHARNRPNRNHENRQQ